ncbi:hypothetical protein ES702_01724 [subsurface metagenome]
MPISDEERDKQFKRDVEAGLSIRQLSEKYGIGLRQISRLKKKLTPTSKPAIQQPTKPTKQQYEKATFYLYPGQLKEIKRLALEKDKNISGLIREMLGRYLKNK